MNTDKLQRIMQALDDIQAQEVICLDIAKVSNMADSMIICSSKSHRHARSILDAILAIKNDIDDSIPVVEGADYAEWILVDYHDTVIHIMLPEVRDYYALEKLWDQHLDDSN